MEPAAQFFEDACAWLLLWRSWLAATLIVAAGGAALVWAAGQTAAMAPVRTRAERISRRERAADDDETN